MDKFAFHLHPKQLRKSLAKPLRDYSGTISGKEGIRVKLECFEMNYQHRIAWKCYLKCGNMAQ